MRYFQMVLEIPYFIYGIIYGVSSQSFYVEVIKWKTYSKINMEMDRWWNHDQRWFIAVNRGSKLLP